MGLFEIQSKLHLLVWVKLLECRFDIKWTSSVLKKRLLYRNVGQTAEFSQWTSFEHFAQKLTAKIKLWICNQQSAMSIDIGFLLNTFEISEQNNWKLFNCIWLCTLVKKTQKRLFLFFSTSKIINNSEFLNGVL